MKPTPIPVQIDPGLYASARKKRLSTPEASIEGYVLELIRRDLAKPHEMEAIMKKKKKK